MSDQKQLTLFNGAIDVASMPPSRVKMLAKIAKEHGIDAAVSRALAIAPFRGFTDAVKNRIDTRGTSAPNLFVSLNRQINAGVGVKRVEDADSEQLLLIAYLRVRFERIIREAVDNEQEKEMRAREIKSIKDLRKAQQKAAA